eukprot:gb/GEZN01010799.1/.p1 GENE.gb/GEZN01010799.1/~~gb/GEZN01010799.1/.p1  ORF type:complete len:380 (+),score=54.39 gb/GEZN01010799.1/:41-1180(+)
MACSTDYRLAGPTDVGAVLAVQQACLPNDMLPERFLLELLSQKQGVIILAETRPSAKQAMILAETTPRLCQRTVLAEATQSSHTRQLQQTSCAPTQPPHEPHEQEQQPCQLSGTPQHPSSVLSPPPIEPSHTQQPAPSSFLSSLSSVVSSCAGPSSFSTPLAAVVGFSVCSEMVYWSKLESDPLFSLRTIINITSLGVAPAHRRQGIARGMIRLLCQHFLNKFQGTLQQNLVQLQLEVRASNTPALELYRSLGLLPQGSQPQDNYYELHSPTFLAEWGYGRNKRPSKTSSMSLAKEQICELVKQKQKQTNMETSSTFSSRATKRQRHCVSAEPVNIHDEALCQNAASRARARAQASKQDLAMWECCGLLHQITNATSLT